MGQALGGAIALGLIALLVIFVATPLLFGAVAAAVSFVVLLIFGVDEAINITVSLIIGLITFSITLYTLISETNW